MIKIFKSNKFIPTLLIILCFFLIFNPKTCSNSCLNAISVWAINVFPVMFPFFILTRLIVQLSNNKQNFLDKFFSKTYKAPSGSLSIFFLSALSGYPMGAKLICNIYDQGRINTQQAKHMLSFCSVSGPMFMLGTVGIGILKSYKSGLIILISNIIAALINGFIFRNKEQSLTNISYNHKQPDNILSSTIYDSIVSILMVGGYIILSFLIIDTLKTLQIIPFISNSISNIFKGLNPDIIESILNGIIEITRGIIDISNCSTPLHIKTIISSGLIGFGGLSIMLQSCAFLRTLKLSFKTILIQKITQSILSIIVTIILVFLIF